MSRWAGVLTMGMLLPLAASAQSGLGFLKNSPINYFNNEDIRLMRKNVDDLLAKGEQGAKGQWSNPKTKHAGEAEITETFSADGMSCKRVRVINQAKGLKSDASYPLCNYPGKGWRVRQE
ncbi:MAG TPA: hypothetical protein VFL64_13345 [Rhizobacter sp.]|nr:hypothetical protein [Rhizobacter sp.]